MKWHLIHCDEVIRLTDSQLKGLSSAQAVERITIHGPNALPAKKPSPPWIIFLRQFKDLMILILLASAMVSGFIGGLKDSVVIVVIVVLNAIIGFWQEYKAGKAIDALKKMSVPLVLVIRDGVHVQVLATDLVPGDIVTLETGNLVPADIRLLKSHYLQIEESPLTGESFAVEKQTVELVGEDLSLGDRTNMAYKGTTVTYGRGVGVVVATGMNTEIGRIAQLLQEEALSTPLQKKLADFGKKTSLSVLVICIVLFIVGLLRGEEPLRMLLTAISLAVAAIPEALPAVVTIALAMGARRLVHNNVLVRKLAAVETLGSVTYICSDKTGTLTQNKMAVSQTWVPETPPSGLNLSPQEALLRCMALNHDVKKNGAGVLNGESTEVALSLYAERHGAHLHLEEYPRVWELPFDAERKMMTTVHQLDGHQYWVVTKGAMESVLHICTDSDVSAMLQEGEKMGKTGLRVLAYACKVVDTLPLESSFASLEHNLQCCGLVGLTDPPRAEAATAIQDCRKAGIVPVMITGDHPVTAASIARQLGILSSPTDQLITGAALQHMPEAVFEAEIEHIKVYARVSPEQKLQIVKALQQKNQFVAMTGDGVNDAPALQRANIGIAMGITGTDVAKQAAHMILLDDNFATIVKAVKEGRRIFDNIRKFIKYAMTGNSGEIWTIFLAPLVGLPMPLFPIHILWINLVTDGLPGLALATERAEKNIMDMPPRKPGENIFAYGLGWHIFWVGLLMGAVCLSVQAWSFHHNDPKWQTYVFTVLCFSQMGHAMAIRSDHFFLFRQGLFTNLPLIGTIALTFCLHLALLYIPALQDIFSTTPLTLQELTACILVSLIVFHAVEMEKLLRSRGKQRSRA
jgi:Ca2+-transporting ATPase